MADLILATHALFVVFVVLGLVAVLLGKYRRRHWLHKILFQDFDPWVITVAYTVPGIMVLAAWLPVPPENILNR